MVWRPYRRPYVRRGSHPDGYDIVYIPGRPVLHLLLELGRSPEQSRVLREKAKRYRDTLHSSLRVYH